MSNWKHYLKIDLPPTFDEKDADTIKRDLMAYINSKDQYGALYGQPSDKKGITIHKIRWITNDN